MAERFTTLRIVWDDHELPDPNWGAALRTGGLDVQSVTDITHRARCGCGHTNTEHRSDATCSRCPCVALRPARSITPTSSGA